MHFEHCGLLDGKVSSYLAVWYTSMITRQKQDKGNVVGTAGLLFTDMEWMGRLYKLRIYGAGLAGHTDGHGWEDGWEFKG